MTYPVGDGRCFVPFRDKHTILPRLVFLLFLGGGGRTIYERVVLVFHSK